MITVYRGKYKYHFDGERAYIRNTDYKVGFKIWLNQWDIISCNKSNKYIDMLIDVNKDILG